MEDETSVTRNLVTLEAESVALIRYDIPHQLVPNIWKGRYRGQEQKWFLMRYHGTADEIDLKTAHPEFSAWKWIMPDELVAGIVPFKREVYDKVLAEFRSKL